MLANNMLHDTLQHPLALILVRSFDSQSFCRNHIEDDEIIFRLQPVSIIPQPSRHCKSETKNNCDVNIHISIRLTSFHLDTLTDPEDYYPKCYYYNVDTNPYAHCL